MLTNNTMSTTHILLLLMFASSVSTLPCIDPEPWDGGLKTLIKCARDNSPNHTCALYIRRVTESRQVLSSSLIIYSGGRDADVDNSFSCYTYVDIRFADSKDYVFKMVVNGESLVAGCPDGRYGDSCSKRCYCIGELCTKENGTCLRGCDPGYNHPSCSIPRPAIEGETTKSFTNTGMSVCMADHTPVTKLTPLHYMIGFFFLCILGAILPFFIVKWKYGNEEINQEPEGGSTNTFWTQSIHSLFDDQQTKKKKIWKRLPHPHLPFFGKRKQKENQADNENKKSGRVPLLRAFGKTFSTFLKTTDKEQPSQSAPTTDINQLESSGTETTDTSNTSESSSEWTEETSESSIQTQTRTVNTVNSRMSRFLSLPGKSMISGKSMMSSLTARTGLRRSTLETQNVETKSELISNAQSKATKKSAKSVQASTKTLKEPNAQDTLKAPSEAKNQQASPEKSDRQTNGKKSEPTRKQSKDINQGAVNNGKEATAKRKASASTQQPSPNGKGQPASPEKTGKQTNNKNKESTEKKSKGNNQEEENNGKKSKSKRSASVSKEPPPPDSKRHSSVISHLAPKFLRRSSSKETINDTSPSSNRLGSVFRKKSAPEVPPVISE